MKKKYLSTLSFAYLIIGIILITTFDIVIEFVNHSNNVSVGMYLAKGWLLVILLLSAGIIYALTKRYLGEITQANTDLLKSYQNLARTNDDLNSAQNELRQQYDQLRLLANQLTESEQMLRSLFDNLNEALFLADIIYDDEHNPVDGRFIDVNPSFENHLGLPAAKIKNRLISESFPEFKQYWLQINALLTNSDNSVIISDYSNDPKKSFNIKGYRPQPDRIAIIIVDITEQKTQEAKIRHMAYHDGLTNLPNRLLFAERMSLSLAHAKRREEKLAVFFLDLDNFKYVNDTFGHTAGDDFLRCIAQRILVCCREEDTVARMGGDEFAVILSGVEKIEDATLIVDRILQGVNTPWVCQGQEFITTASVGIAFFPQDGEDADELLKAADLAMYYVKSHGKHDYKLFSNLSYSEMIEKSPV